MMNRTSFIFSLALMHIALVNADAFQNRLPSKDHTEKRKESDLKESEFTLRLAMAAETDPDFAKLFPGSTDFSKELFTIYTERCAQCHGLKGRGLPSGGRVFPFSADYMSWKSTKIRVPPTQEDIANVIKEGLPRNQMPGSADLGNEVTGKLAEYVRYLAVINETAHRLRISSERGEETTKEAELARVASRWEDVTNPKNSLGKVAENSSPESIKRGEALFNHKRIRCDNCHGHSGKGGGNVNSSVVVLYHEGETLPAVPGHFDALHRKINVPALHGLSLNQSSRQQVYNRIAAGIPNARMPGVSGRWTPQDISDIADFVLSIADTEKGSQPKDQ